MFDKGTGVPVVFVQGVQGRWEWMRGTLEEIARSCRAVAYSLPGDIGAARRYDRTRGFDQYLEQLDEVLNAARLERTALCGISFGGFIAVRYAALHPERVSALVLVSAPGPGWSPSAQQARWLSKPWLSTPAFVATAPFRVWPEVRCALQGTSACVGFLVRQGLRVVAAPAIPSLMSARVRDARALDFPQDCARIHVPTLVITGDEELDRVVPVEATRRYAAVIKGARYEQMKGTGHLGLLTQPRKFARLISEFVHAHSN